MFSDKNMGEEYYKKALLARAVKKSSEYITQRLSIS